MDLLTPLLLATAEMSLPFVLGLLGGRVLRLVAGRRLQGAGAGLLLFAIPVLSSLVPAPYALGLGYWDLLLVCLLFGLGVFITSHRARPRADARTIALGLMATLFALVILESGTRLLLPEPPVFPHPRYARLFRFEPLRHPTALPSYREGIFPGTHPALFAERTAPAANRVRVVLHVGDSMLEGDPVEIEETFPALLHARSRRTAHVNAGVSAVGPDFMYLLVRAWTDRLRPDVVIMYLFVGNDLQEMDGPYSCCRDGPLLTYGPKGPRPRCSGWEPGHSRTRPRLASPPPYPLRVATGFSHAARHLCAQAWRLQGVGPSPDRSLAWEHFESVLRATRDFLAVREIPLLLVVLPARRDLEAAAAGTPQPQKDIRTRMLAIASRLGTQTHDATRLLAPAVARNGANTFFLDQPPGNPHFNRRGHALMATWLERQLGQLFDGG